MALGYFPPHETMDQEKLQKMIKHLESGGELPPVVVAGEYAFTGSHRLRAWEACEEEPNTIEISNQDYRAAMDLLDLDWRYDEPNELNEFCAALYSVTDNDAMKKALEDQRGGYRF
jgi:hypothetical protein